MTSTSSPASPITAPLFMASPKAITPLQHPQLKVAKAQDHHHRELVRRRHSLAPETLCPPKSHHHYLTRNRRSFVFSSTGNTGNPQIVAIDSKIEQAMDLVKTHLMFAVREEVDHLRSKISELEKTVFQLEMENSVLREHVSADVLQNISGTSTPGAPTPPQGASTALTAQ